MTTTSAQHRLQLGEDAAHVLVAHHRDDADEPREAELRGQRGGQRAGAVRVVRGVDEHGRRRPPGRRPAPAGPATRTRGERRAHRVGVQRLLRAGPDQRLRRGQRERRVAAWCSPCSGRKISSYDAAEALQRRAAARRRRSPARARRTRRPRARPARRPRRSAPAAPRPRPVSCAASTATAPGLMIPAFSRAMPRTSVPRYSAWSRPIGVITATVPSATFVASQRAAQPDLDDRRPRPGASANAANPIAVSTSNLRQRRLVPGVDDARRTARRRGRARRSAPGVIGRLSMLIRSVARCRCGLV